MNRKKVIKPDDNFFTWIEITGKCNLKCPYCYATSSVNKDPTEFNDRQLKQLLKNLKDCGMKGAVLSGGEPALKKNVAEFLEYGEKSGLKMMLVTNGTVVTPELIRVLKKYHISVQLSLDTVDDQTFTESRGVPFLEKVLKNIDLLIKEGVDVSLSSTLTKLNYQKIMGLVDYAKDKNIQNVHVGEFIPFGRGKQNQKIFLSQKDHFEILKKLYEYQKENYLFISIDTIENFIYPLVFNTTRKYYCNPSLQINNRGDIEYCVNMPADSRQNILSSKPKKIISKMKENFHHFLVAAEDMDHCRDCPNTLICAGGCRAITYNLYGKEATYKRRHPYCQSYKKIMNLIRKDLKSGQLDQYFDFLRQTIPEGERSFKRYF